MPAPRWVLIWRSQSKKKKKNCRFVQLYGSVLIWHMIDWLLAFNGLLFMGHVQKVKGAPAPGAI
jgi:hypothetical protein